MTEAEQIDRAHEYLSKVVDEEVKTDSNLRLILRAHMGSIISESMKHKGLGKRFRFSEDESLNKKVNEIISRLREDLYSDIEERSLIVKQIAEEKEDSKVDDAIVIAFLLSKIKGNTLKERINLYTGQLKSEVESFISAGIASGLSKDEILTQWLTNVKSPYAAKIMRDAMSGSGFAATRIQSKGIHYGTGRYISSFDNLKRLAITTIGQTYNHARQFAANIKGAYGWYTVRGSSYPCSLCDSETGIFHPITESFLSYHPNCCCQQIFVYKDSFKLSDEVRKRSADIRNIAKSTLVGTGVWNESLNANIVFTTKGIKEFINQPHKYYSAKNESLLNIKEIISKSEYKGWSDYHKENRAILKSHIFQTKIAGKDSWIIIRENTDGEFYFYSMSDNKKVLKRK